MAKWCSGCDQWVPFDCFNRNNTQCPLGLAYICRDCQTARYAKRTPERKAAAKVASRNEYVRKRQNKRWLVVLSKAEIRAKRKGLLFSLRQEDIQPQLDAGVCEVTGVPFDMKSSARQWNTPSLDRIDSSKGYVKSNVRMVCWAVNAMAGEWGIEKAIELAGLIKAKQG